jgi:hypothetical protein
MSEACRWCGQYHGPKCPTVKAIEFHPDGSIKRVEFKTANDYPPSLGIAPPYPIDYSKSVTVETKPGLSWNCDTGSAQC